MLKFKQFLEEIAKPTGDLKKACWTGYTAVGTKKKNGRTVPNCVPEEVELDIEQIDEISKSTLASYKDKSTASLKNAQANRDAAESGKHMSKGFADLHAKSDAIAKKRVQGLKGYLQRKVGMKPTSEEVELEEAKHYPYKFRATYHDPDTDKVTHVMDFTHKSLDAAKKHAEGSRLQRKDGKEDKLHSVVQMKEEVEVIWEAKKDDEDDMPDHEVKVFDYDTNYFYVCPAATKLYKNIEHEVEPDDYDLVEGMAKLQDCIFFIEKHLKEKKGSPKEDDIGYLLVAQNIKDQLDRMLSMTTPKMRLEHWYLQSHIDTIKELLDWENRKEELDEEYEWLEESAAWRRKEGKNPTGGLNRKGIMSYRRENPGSKLSMAVTGKVKPGSKAAKRRKSFCARMGGMKGPMKKPNGEPTRKALALRKWKCR